MDAETVANLVRLAPPQIPAGFDPVCPAAHPAREEAGLLARNRSTGVYALFAVGGAMRSVPARWAEGVAAGYATGLRDARSLAGSVTSDAKAAASRANGAKGGRPRKAPPASAE